MNRSSSAAILLVAALCGPSGLAAQKAVTERKPVTEYPIFVDYFAPPASAREMMSTVAAVVIARYTGQARLVERVTSPGGRPVRDTFHTFEVLDTLKFHSLVPPNGETLELDLPGGDKEYPTRVVRQRLAGAEPLRRGHEYVIFIDWIPNQDRLTIAWGPRGLFDVTNGRVRSVDTDWRRHNGKSRSAFLAELK